MYGLILDLNLRNRSIKTTILTQPCDRHATLPTQITWYKETIPKTEELQHVGSCAEVSSIVLLGAAFFYPRLQLISRSHASQAVHELKLTPMQEHS